MEDGAVTGEEGVEFGEGDLAGFGGERWHAGRSIGVVWRCWGVRVMARAGGLWWMWRREIRGRRHGFAWET